MIYGTGHSTPGGTALPIINLTGGANFVFSLFDVTVGTVSSPADQQIDLEIGRTSSVGTGGTTLTENAFRQITASPSVVPQAAAVGGTFTAAPTYTANSGMVWLPLNQRASNRWVTDPKYGIVSLAVAGAGVELLCNAVTSGTPTIRAHFVWEE